MSNLKELSMEVRLNNLRKKEQFENEVIGEIFDRKKEMDHIRDILNGLEGEFDNILETIREKNEYGVNGIQYISENALNEITDYIDNL